MTEIPTFAQYWQLTTKVGKKEMYAGRWHNRSDKDKIVIFNTVKQLKQKPSQEEYLKSGVSMMEQPHFTP